MTKPKKPRASKRSLWLAKRSKALTGKRRRK